MEGTLIVFGGLPGVGKTTISREVAIRLRATVLRIDAIEQAIRNARAAADDVGTAGYTIAHTIAEANFGCGRTVVVDCVNPVRESRIGWRKVATRANVRLVEVEIVCSDPIEHRRRVEARRPDIEGIRLPTWRDVRNRRYEPWDAPDLRVDSANMSPIDAALAVIRQASETVGAFAPPLS